MACALLWGGCKESPTQSDSTPGFALYMLDDSTITATEAWRLSLDSLSLSDSPLLTENDLTAYYWSSHSFSARPNIDTLFGHMRWLGGRSFGVPFVVVARGNRVYVGGFWWAYSSSMPMGSYIDTYAPPPYAIQHHQSASMPDMRNDQRVYDALKAAGILVD